MSFVHPIAVLVGAGLLGLPLAVHLLTRPRPTRFPFSALRFLDSALRQRRFFARLRDVFVLSLRVLLLVAVAGAFARPLLLGAAPHATQDVGRRVVVLDVSRSMSARKGGVRVFDRAQAEALGYVKRNAGLRANVLFAGAKPRAAFDTFSANWPSLEAEVRRARPRDEELDARAALAGAGQLLSEPGGDGKGRGQIVVITDLQETNWHDVSGAGLPGDVDVLVEYVGLGPNAGNLALAKVAADGRAEAGQPVRLRAEVQNFSGSDQLRVVELTAGDHVYRQEVHCDAWASAFASFEVGPFEGSGARWITGAARILEAHDALPADDVRHFVVRLGEPPTYLVVSREDPRRVGTSSYFLSRMLCPTGSLQGAAGERFVYVSPGDLGVHAVRQADLLAITKPGRMPPEALAAVAELLLRGLPVLYVAAEPSDAENLAALQTACGGALSLPVKFTAWTAAPSSDGGRATGLSLRDVQAGAAPLRAFGDAIGQLTSGVTASAILKTGPVAGGVPEDVLARWSDGSAAMVVAPAGAGSLVVWNADLVRSTLPRSAFFVALLRETAELLLNADVGPGGALPVGSARLVPLPAGVESVSGLSVVGPEGQAVEGAVLEEAAAGATWRWPTVGPPGVYRVMRGEETVFAAAADCPATEADLRPADADAVAKRLTPGDASGTTSQAVVIGLPGGRERQEPTELWPWLLVAALAFIVVELCTLKLFRV
jgi:hypothetical protein